MPFPRSSPLLVAVGIDPNGYSGHSLWPGFVASAAQARASTLKIRAQTGHAMLSRDIRDSELFTGNVAGGGALGESAILRLATRLLGGYSCGQDSIRVVWGRRGGQEV